MPAYAHVWCVCVCVCVCACMHACMCVCVCVRMCLSLIQNITEVRNSFTWDVSDAVVGLDTAGGSPAEATGSLPAEHHGRWLCVAVGRQGGQQGQHSFLLPTSYSGNKMASLSDLVNKDTPKHIHEHTITMHTYTCTHTCVCMHAHTHTHTHTHAHMHARTNACTHTRMHACTHAHTFSPIRLFTCCCSISLLTIMVGHKNTISLLCPDYLIALI